MGTMISLGVGKLERKDKQRRKQMKAVIYARFSSDNQREESIE